MGGRFVLICAVCASVLGFGHQTALAAVERTGTLRAIVFDDFERDRSVTRYRLLSGQEATVVRPTRLAAEPGDRVEVTGEIREGRLVGSVEATTTSVEEIAAGPRKTAVVLFTFAGEAVAPWSPAATRADVFTATKSVGTFYREESYGDISLVGKLDEEGGDVFGWLSIDTPPGGCAYASWRAEAEQEAADDGIDLSGYQHVIYAFPYQPSCSWLGIAELSGDWSMINGNFATVHVVAHELGHNLGLRHAGSWTCTEDEERVQISDTCTTAEYGDPFDAMGNLATRHNNGWNLAILDVLAPENVETIEASGTYSLRSALNPTAEPTTLRIPRTKSLAGVITSWYYLEVRETGGVFENLTDASTAGVSIRATAEGAPTETLLLDMNPGTSSFHDAPLADGQVFNDPKARITTLTAGAGSATVSVELDEEPPTAPTELTATTEADGVHLQWSESSDAFGVERYLVFRDGTEIGTTSTPAFRDSSVSSGEHEYVAYAEDAAGNRSTGSEPLMVTVAALSGPTCTNATCTVTFRIAGEDVTWPVPPGVGEAEFTVEGGKGGGEIHVSIPGRGARVTATIGSLVTGEPVTVTVGGAGQRYAEGGAGGFNGGGDGVRGGGGGGFSSVEIDGELRLLAGGGGGWGSNGFNAVTEEEPLGGRGGRSRETGAPGNDGGATEAHGATLQGGTGGGANGSGGPGGAGGAVTGASACSGGAFAGASGNPGSSFVGGGGAPNAGGGGGGGYVGGGQGGGGASDACGSSAGSGGGGAGSSFAAPGVSADFSFLGPVRPDGQVSIAYSNPLAAADRTYTIEPDQELDVPAADGVLAGASGPAGVTLSADVLSSPAHGLLVLDDDGSFAYTPDSGYVGADSFVYRVTDPSGHDATATAVLTVAGPPTATISAPLAGKTYTLGESVKANFACTEGPGGPGISSCTGTVANGDKFDISSTGTHTFEVIAISQDGLESRASASYEVEAPPPAVEDDPPPVADPPPPVVEVPPPVPLVAAIGTARARVVHRIARVMIACRGGVPGSVCRGVLSLTTPVRSRKRRRARRKGAAKALLLGRTRYAVASGRARFVAVRVRAVPLRRLLRRKRTRPLTLRARTTATAAGGRHARRTILLRFAAARPGA